MTENAINADSQVALANTLEKLNHTLGNLNTTMEKIQQGHEAQKRILGPKTRIFLKFTAATLTGFVVLYLFFFGICDGRYYGKYAGRDGRNATLHGANGTLYGNHERTYADNDRSNYRDGENSARYPPYARTASARTAS